MSFRIRPSGGRAMLAPSSKPRSQRLGQRVATMSYCKVAGMIRASTASMSAGASRQGCAPPTWLAVTHHDPRRLLNVRQSSRVGEMRRGKGEAKHYLTGQGMLAPDRLSADAAQGHLQGHWARSLGKVTGQGHWARSL